jgi:hypothetical protein
VGFMQLLLLINSCSGLVKDTAYLLSFPCQMFFFFFLFGLKGKKPNVTWIASSISICNTITFSSNVQQQRHCHSNLSYYMQNILIRQDAISIIFVFYKKTSCRLLYQKLVLLHLYLYLYIWITQKVSFFRVNYTVNLCSRK